jgi:mRNA interferase MazF
VVIRGEVWLAALDPTVGSEIRKTRPCIVISPGEMNDFLRTVIIAPMTTAGSAAPYRVPISFENKRGLILLDQIRALDQRRLVKRLGEINPKTLDISLGVLREMFSA